MSGGLGRRPGESEGTRGLGGDRGNRRGPGESEGTRGSRRGSGESEGTGGIRGGDRGGRSVTGGRTGAGTGAARGRRSPAPLHGFDPRRSPALQRTATRIPGPDGARRAIGARGPLAPCANLRVEPVRLSAITRPISAPCLERAGGDGPCRRIPRRRDGPPPEHRRPWTVRPR